MYKIQIGFIQTNVLTELRKYTILLLKCLFECQCKTEYNMNMNAQSKGILIIVWLHRKTKEGYTELIYIGNVWLKKAEIVRTQNVELYT